MDQFPLWRRILRLPLPRKDRENAPADVDAELEFHLQMRVGELMARGASESEAREAALRRFGDLGEARATLIRQTAHRAGRRRVAFRLEDLAQDLGHAVRGLRRRPILTLTAITTLALGLGLTTGVFAVVNRLVLNPLPYPGAERLAHVLLASNESALRISPELRMVAAWRAHLPGAEWVEAYDREELLLEGGETAELVQTRSVTPGLLPALGARIMLGRGLEPSDTVAGASPVALLSWAAWQRRFGGSRGALDRSVRIDGRVVTLVGVLERGFDLTSLDGSARAEFWLPLGGPGTVEQSVATLTLRKAGISTAALSTQLRSALSAASITSDFIQRFPATAVDPAEMADQGRERTLWLLTLAVGLVLAVACANVAALLLGQATVRAGELRIRVALGAGRGRLMRQLLTEAGLLGVIGGLGGIGMAHTALWLTRLWRPGNLLTLDDVSLDPIVLLAAGGLTLLIAVLFGLAPAWTASRVEAPNVFGGRLARSFDTRYGRSFRSLLVIGQLAASLVLVYGAGTLLRSFVIERNLPLGFDPRGLGWVNLGISRRTIPEPAERQALADRALAAVSIMPGVQAAALAGDSPLNYGIMEAEFLIDGRPLPESPVKQLIPVRTVTPEYFATIGMPVEAGRAPDRSSPLEVVIDRVTARRFFPRGDAIGSRIRFERDQPWRTIVAIVPEERTLLGAFPNEPLVYVLPTEGDRTHFLLVRTEGNLPLERVSAAVRQVDSRIRIRSVDGAEAILADQLAPRRFAMTIVIGFAGLALLLAGVGLYGVVALAVSQRTWEMGVRLALGARPAVLRLEVLRQGAIRVAVGLLLGFVLVAVAGRMLRTAVSGVNAWDPLVWGISTLVLAAAGVLACWIPARRASRVDPVIALRAE